MADEFVLNKQEITKTTNRYILSVVNVKLEHDLCIDGCLYLKKYPPYYIYMISSCPDSKQM